MIDRIVRISVVVCNRIRRGYYLSDLSETVGVVYLR